MTDPETQDQFFPEGDLAGQRSDEAFSSIMAIPDTDADTDADADGSHMKRTGEKRGRVLEACVLRRIATGGR